MSDSQLEPKYLEQREQLKGIVKSLIAPKIMSAKLVNGKEFVELLRKTLDALNKGKIPSAGTPFLPSTLTTLATLSTLTTLTALSTLTL